MIVTPLYAGLLALWYLALSLRVVQKRNKVSLGDGGDTELLRRIRGHGNFAEYVPLILVMLGFMELSRFSLYLIHALGITLLVSRLLHGYALSYTTAFKFGRFWGALLTFVVLLVSAVCCVYQGVLGVQLL
ncbi:MAG: MAPEG family protein [Pseudomonadota bacterium]